MEESSTPKASWRRIVIASLSAEHLDAARLCSALKSNSAFETPELGKQDRGTLEKIEVVGIKGVGFFVDTHMVHQVVTASSRTSTPSQTGGALWANDASVPSLGQNLHPLMFSTLVAFEHLFTERANSVSEGGSRTKWASRRFQ